MCSMAVSRKVIRCAADWRLPPYWATSHPPCRAHEVAAGVIDCVCTLRAGLDSGHECDKSLPCMRQLGTPKRL
jgi:hypothetical protein